MLICIRRKVNAGWVLIGCSRSICKWSFLIQPPSTKLITCPLSADKETNNSHKKGLFILLVHVRCFVVLTAVYRNNCFLGYLKFSVLCWICLLVSVGQLLCWTLPASQTFASSMSTRSMPCASNRTTSSANLVWQSVVRCVYLMSRTLHCCLYIQLVSISLPICESLDSSTENSQSPYSATVVINDIQYGTGYASSKKAAKVEAGLHHF